MVENTYAIRLKGTELYITISSEKTNSTILLFPKDSSAKQQGRLVMAPAVANAVFNATGKRIRSLPITPDKLIGA